MVALCFLMTFSNPIYAQYIGNTAVCLNPAEKQLVDQLNAYRVANGRTPVPISRSLSTVGQWHVWDQLTNNPVTGPCNLHSWSAAMPGLWTPVCYLPDHSAATGMWHKPREITNNIYTAFGYEISASGVLTPQAAVQAWSNSSAHNDVILNNGVWSNIVWRSVGVGYVGTTANVWFGDITDPQGSMPECSEVPLFVNGFEE